MPAMSVQPVDCSRKMSDGQVVTTISTRGDDDSQKLEMRESQCDQAEKLQPAQDRCSFPRANAQSDTARKRWQVQTRTVCLMVKGK